MGQADGLGFGEGRPRLRRGLRVTHLGDERLVLDPASGVVHTVRGPAVPVLDRLLRAPSALPTIDRSADEGEVLAAFAAVGLLTHSGWSRRQALEVAAGASILITSALLPSALAAASGEVAFDQGTDGIFRSFTLADNTKLYSLTHEFLLTASVSRNLVVGSSPRRVELVLVGGGGGGGSGVEDVLIYAGGGGGGEVRYVDLGTVSASTSFELTVAGRASAESSGQSTIVDNLTTASEIAVATGGGRGGSNTSASSGGSGGGGSSAQAAAGSSLIGSGLGVTRFGSAGAVGNDGEDNLASGGGGGAGSSLATTGSGITGGNGRSAKPLSDFFDLDGATVTGQLNLGGGGGGAGSGSDLANAGTPGLGAGRGGYVANGTALAGDSGEPGSGGGGGGGLSSITIGDASGGRGATGAIWVRVS